MAPARPVPAQADGLLPALPTITPSSPSAVVDDFDSSTTDFDLSAAGPVQVPVFPNNVSLFREPVVRYSSPHDPWSDAALAQLPNEMGS